MEYPEQVKPLTKKKWVVPRGWEERKMWSNYVMGIGFYFELMKKFWDQIQVMVIYTVNVLNASL